MREENRRVAEIFLEIADMTDILADDPYRGRAYRRAAQSVEGLTEALARLANEERLEEIPGVGGALAGKIREILDRGTCDEWERLREELPAGILQLLEVPGLGPKTAGRLYRELAISSLAELEAAAEEQRLRGLKGLGAKSEERLLAGVHQLKRLRQRMLLGEALPLAEDLCRWLAERSDVEAALPAGSVRRGRATIGDLDLVVSATAPHAVTEAVAGHPAVREVLGAGRTWARVRIPRPGGGTAQVDVRAVTPDSFAAALQHFTGAKAHNIRLRGRARRGGYQLNEYGLFRRDGDNTDGAEQVSPDGAEEGRARDPEAAPGSRTPGEPVALADEEAIYRALGLAPIPPELREDRGELEAAEAGSLPVLVERAEIRGDLHVHSRWSDGTAELEELAAWARRLGYGYLAVCDHSPSLVVANGLSPEELAAQWEAIDELNTRWDDFRLLKGTEVDILADGELDLPDALLARADWVVASVHSGLSQSRERITRRICRALEHPLVDQLGHPTGRLLGRREAYAVELDRVFDVAGRTGTALELNASPHRLDLGAAEARRAAEAGIPIVINTDAHRLEALDEMRYGIITGRRAWLGREQVLNTCTLEELMRWRSQRRKAAGA